MNVPKWLWIVIVVIVLFALFIATKANFGGSANVGVFGKTASISGGVQ